MLFIEKTASQYPELTLDELRSAFEEVKEELHKMDEEENNKTRSKKAAKSQKEIE
jgi:hypothetical protein